MSRPIRRTDTDPGWINRGLREVKRKQRQQTSAKRAQATTVGSGGITIRGGGDLTIEDGGTLTVRDGAGFTAEYPNGNRPAVTFGPATTTDGRTAQALWVRDENGKTTFAGMRIPYDPAFPAYPDGQRIVQIGSGTQNVSYFTVQSEQLVFQVGGAEITMAAGGINLAGSPVKLQVGTTASAANAYIDAATGQVLRSTSSLRYKQDVEDAEVDVDAVLSLQPRRYRRKDDVEKLGDDAPTYVGFIAEEANALGLADWVTSDDEGPEAFSYATYVVALQAVARRQALQIADLTARLDALESSTEGA